MNFSYTVERFIVIRDGEELLVLESEVLENEEAEWVEVDIDGDIDGEYIPAKLFGAPEDCHPDESWCEITKVRALPPYERFGRIELTDEEEERIEDAFGDGDGNDDYADYDPPDCDYDLPDEDYGDDY